MRIINQPVNTVFIMDTSKQEIPSVQISRRAFLGKALFAGAGLAVLSAPDLAEAVLRTGKRKLSFYHTHTGKELELVYAVGKSYNPLALNRINSYLGDFRTGEVHSIDPKLLDMLWALQCRCGKAGVFSVISGYRSPQTNTSLRGRSTGVAKKSLHMEGRAIDVRFSEAPTKRLKDHAVSLKAGGVGFYASSDFVHLDTGRYRTW